ncbi:hypothetical protein A6V36_35425 [Paraburkholderia ginsengiterrae]|uniref:Uncharacterized protein n=1 Tax=Paraburkholderia ginsengiterrae TaxID=1462993 RepID=A0A1A9MXJ1_9BURK|nr:hypothetical protein [Paraburkholderia ginsengiterrae]OAJ52286.1 hypothetical protein A6V37_36910 [Paraburkholderia ginsengiterrae]OAJ55217.1 hypothetical protein A6V36_35425 [Paraburkholderia ginsengiterrae]
MMKNTILTLVLALSLAPSAHAEGNAADTFHLVREVVIEKGSIPDPATIERLNDEDFVIAGRMPKDKAAWATYVDRNGTVRWRYTMTSVNPEPGGSYPEFVGAMATPDGGVLLCGRMDLGQPRKPAISGMLVKLNETGQLISKQFVTPQAGSNVAQVSFLDGCVAWLGGFALTGGVTRYAAGGQRTDFHWIAAVNADGTVKWQKLISKQLVGGGAPGQVRSMPEGNLLVSVMQGEETEVILVDAQGELRARSILPARFRLVQSLNPQANPELFACYGGKSRGELVYLTMDLRISKETDCHLHRVTAAVRLSTRCNCIA